MDNEYFMSEIHKLLKLGPDLSRPYEEQIKESAADVNPELMLNLPVQTNYQSADSIVPNFRTADDIVPNFRPASSAANLENYFQTPPQALHEKEQEPLKHAQTPGKKISLSGLLVYPLVFAIAFGFFYLIMNFGAIVAQVQGWFAKNEDEQILQADLTEYNNWINGYYFAVGDKEKLEPNGDIDFDGLTNLDEFTIKTNPTISDSDTDGVSDGIEIINGTNPWGLGKLSDKQKKIVDKLDIIKINNRVSFNAASNTTNAATHTQNFDTTRPGRLSIPKLGLQVPIIWSEDPVEFDKDLTRGVVHYPGTALPGENGIVYISGHSSDYFWKNHPYKQVFAKLNALDPGDDIFVDVYGEDGKIYNYRYRVSTETVFAPDDQRQFLDNTGPKLNLSTCWPIGTQRDRYVVTAELQNP